ncbi:SIMPL domain-containing protein [Poseidonibacter lekithochrous]|uniref:SIMPL domain-containing protein n=1 Tax=Poseidonibacter TaxID=2321187 RepID=UPI001C08D506|nr:MULTISPECIES: SIMPL domain-containing protein [Poseidonibacter]MBU3014314.1 SIMPL domain-containing protein [Poseidonibacter lekithochrous]MDO6827612.1 SIMPL domain-containing protein [Poseidonibacter sp. 1_MG-2023]
MKFRIIFTFLLALLLPMSLFSYEISFNKKFSKLVSPDLLTTYVNISIENDSERFINENIEKYNDYIKGNNLIEKTHGNFTLSPKYNYFKNTQKFIGYVGSLKYTIKAKNASNLNRFINDLIELEKKLDKNNVKLRISNVSWIISEKLYDNSLDTLRIDAMTWIERYSKSLKNVLSKNCTVKSININKSNNQLIRASQMESLSSKRISNVAPVNSNQEISIEPNFLLECK